MCMYETFAPLLDLFLVVLTLECELVSIEQVAVLICFSFPIATLQKEFQAPIYGKSCKNLIYGF